MIERIQNDTNVALKAGDKKTAEALRLLLSTLKNAQIDNGGSLPDDKAMAVIKKEIKKRIEARDLFSANDRQEQAAQEEFERNLYSHYVPEELNTEAIDSLIKEAAVGLDELKFSALMPAVMAKAKGQADGRLVSERVKLFLENGES
jgi:uncharacterized protein YqeY